MARGLIDLATELNNRQMSAVAKVGIPPDTGLEQAFAGFAKDFKVIGDEIGRMADKAAAKEGELEGKFAGLDPNFRTRGDGSIRSEAFDRAGLQIAETRLNQQLEAGIAGVEAKAGGDPQELAKGISGVGAGVLKGVPDELKPKFMLKLRGRQLSAMREAARQQVARTRAEQGTALQEELSSGYKETQRLAFTLGLDGEADKALAERMGLLREALARKGTDGKPLIAPERAEKYIATVKGEITEARIMGAFDRLRSPEEKATFLKQLEANWQSGSGIAREFDLDGMMALRGKLEREMRHDEGRRNVQSRLLEKEISEAADLAAKGYPIGAEKMGVLKAQAAQSDDPRLAVALESAEHLAKFHALASSRTPAELEDFIGAEDARLKSGGATKAAVGRLEMSRKILANMRAGLKSDPNAWADRTGVVPRAAVDVSSPEKLAATLPGRIATAEEVASRYDNPVQYLDQDEKRRLIALAAPGGAHLMDVVASVTAAAGTRAPKVLAELGKDAPTLAVLGGHIATIGKSGVAQDVADGVALTRTKDWKGHTLSADKTAELALSVHKGALAGLPANEKALIDATNYAYAVRLQRAGKLESNALWQQTFRELAGERNVNGETYGGVAVWRGAHLMVPPDVKKDGFGELIKAIVPEDFGDDPPLTRAGPAGAGDLRGAKLVPSGAGRFHLNLGDDETPQWLVDKSGRPYELDFKKLKQRLIERRPDLYIDGGWSRSAQGEPNVP